MTTCAGQTQPGSGGADDPLDAASAALDDLEALPLERHPEAFARFDELLREALESPPQVSSG